MVKVKTPPKAIRIATTVGHVLNLPASTEVNIPESALSDALARGCAIADEDYEVLEETKPVYGKEALDRKAANLVRITIEEMMKDKKDNEWTQAGEPDAKAIGRRAKIKVDRKLRDKVWSDMRNERIGDS